MWENEPHQMEEKSFRDLMKHARDWKNEFRKLHPHVFTKIGLMRTEKDRLHMFVIGTAAGGSYQTLYSCQVPVELFAKPRKDDLDLPFKQAFHHDPFYRQNPPSAEFSMMCERQRSSVVTGVADYECARFGQMLLLAGDELFRFTPRNNLLQPVNINQAISSQRMDTSEQPAGPGSRGCSAEAQESSPAAAGSSSARSTTSTASRTIQPSESANFISCAKICPSNEHYLAYVLNKQIYIEFQGRVVYRTTSNSKHIFNGVASYIVQEELERFEGIWWSPTQTRMLYEHTNEEMVEDAQFGINGEAPSPPMKYPKAGRPNAVSTLRMVIFEGGKVYDVAMKEGLLRQHCPQYEYITRAGFFSDGTTVWVQLMNRDQSECSLILIPATDFELPREIRDATPPAKGLQLSNDLNMGTWNETSHEEVMAKPPTGKISQTVVIHRARSDYWINVHNAIYPLKIANEKNPVYEFIYCLEKPNGSCLALISAELDENGYCRHTEEKLLMSETHSIHKSMSIVVDEKRELVYFVANESHPTEWNVCVSHYRSGKNAILTERGLSFKPEKAHPKLAVDVDYGFGCWMNSVGTAPQCRFYAFRWTEGEVLPTAHFGANFAIPNTQQPKEDRPITPEIIEYQSKRTQLVHYALVIRPPNFNPRKKYPVLHYVYGGPGIQIVHNDYTWIQWLRFAQLGYVVVMLDNRGTANRGIEFERHISKRMGTVEVEDQHDGLLQIMERCGGFMDANRVVVHGWSYGGYIALQLIAKHPNMYRAAMAGGAVFDWKLYDTAYTERYMGYPVEEHAYSGSSMNYLVELFPEEPNRLMIIHGLMDENVHAKHMTDLVDCCVRQGKWHELLLFPNERHGIRALDANIYLDARMMYFAQRAIQGL